MEGYEVTNDQGGKAWWDGKNLMPITTKSSDLSLDQLKEKSSKEQGALSKAQADPGASLMSSSKEIEAKARKGVPAITAQPARFPKTEKFVQESAGPAATLAAGLIPGALPIQMGLGAATEALGQKLGGKELDPAAIAGAAAVPAGVRGLIGAGKAVARSVSKMVNKEGMLEAGVSKIQDKFGLGNKATKALDAAKSNATKLTDTQLDPISEKLIHTIEAESKNLGGSKEAIKVAEEIFDKVNSNQYTYGDMFESITGLRQMANTFFSKGDSRGGNAIKNIRSAAIDQLDTLGPEASEAIKLYKRQESLEDISHVLRTKGRPVNAFEDMMKNDKLVASAFTDAEKKQLTGIVKDLGTENLLKIVSAAGLIGAGGYGGYQSETLLGKAGSVTGAAMPIVLGALVSTPVGKVFAKSLIGPGGQVSKAVMPAFAQYLRGYMAQQGSEGPTKESAEAGSKLGGAGGF